LIDLEEGPRLFSRLVECDPREVAIGMTVAVRWEDAPGDNSFRLPVFAPTSEDTD
jgi:uncharacterized OB-fold protein